MSSHRNSVRGALCVALVVVLLVVDPTFSAKSAKSKGANKQSKCPAMEKASWEQLDFYARELLDEGQKDGDKEKAVAALDCWNRALKLEPGRAHPHYSIGDVYMKVFDDTENFIRHYERGLAMNPQDKNNAHAHGNLATMYFKQNNFGAAEKHYRLALKLDKKNHSVMFALSQVLEKNGDPSTAMSMLESAINLYGEDPRYFNNLGVVQGKLGRVAESLRSYREAIDIEPEFPDAYFNLGQAYFSVRQYDKAVEVVERGLKLNKKNTAGILLLATILADSQQYNKAMSQFKLAHESLGGQLLDPHHAISYGLTKGRVCDWSAPYSRQEISASISQQLASGALPSVHPFSAITLDLSAAELLSFARLQAAAYLAAATAGPFKPRTYRPADLKLPSSKKSAAKLHIGYISQNFGNHPTAELVELALRHDRDRIQVSCYDGSPSDTGVSERLRGSCDHFVELYNMKGGTTEIVERMTRDHLSVLVNLDGMTRGHTSGLLPLKLAPVSVNFLGFPGSIGRDVSDIMVADRIVVPPEYAGHYDEKILYLPHAYQPNIYPLSYPDVLFEGGTADREDAGFPDSRDVLFCNLGQMYKVDPSVFDMWLRILKAVPGSKMWLLQNPADAEVHLTKYAAERGVDRERFFWTPLEDKNAHMKRVGFCDVFLDTVVVSSHTTALDVLWRGVPVIALQGEQFVKRVAASLLVNVGTPVTIARTMQEYEALAVFLGQNPRVISRLKKQLAKTKADSPLFNGEQWSRDYDRANRLMWEVRTRRNSCVGAACSSDTAPMWHIVVGRNAAGPGGNAAGPGVINAAGPGGNTEGDEEKEEL